MSTTETPQEPVAQPEQPVTGQPAEPRPSDLVKDEFPSTTPSASLPTVEDLEEAMRDVVDPELMVNVVDLGLVYGIHIDEQANCTIDMTLTSPTCPLTDRIEYDTQSVLEGLVNKVTINWVWLPPWSLEMISDDGREQLRSIGFNV